MLGRFIADLLTSLPSLRSIPECETSNMEARVAWIYVAPVKGLALAQREEVLLEPAGVRENRRFHLTGEEGRLLNGKQLGELFQVAADWDEAAGTLALRFPDGAVVAAKVELGEPVATNFYGHRDVPGHVVDGPWAEALSLFAGCCTRVPRPRSANGS
jgi:uncharacterized protein YcbX